MIRQIIMLSAALHLLAGGPAFAEDELKPASVPTNLEMLEELARRVVDESAVRIPLSPGETVLVRRSGDHAAAWVVENYLAGRLVALGMSVYLEPEPAEPAREEGESAQPSRGEEAGGRRRPGAQDTTAAGRGAEGDTTALGPGGYLEEAGEDTIGVTSPEDDVAPAKPQAPPEEAETGPGPGQGGFTGMISSRFPFANAPSPDRVLEFRVGELDVGYTRRWRKSLFGTAMVERSARAAIFFRLLDGKDGEVLWTDSGRSQKRDVVPQKLLAQLEDTPGQTGPKSAGGGGIGRVVEPIVVSGIVVGLVLLFYSSRT